MTISHYTEKWGKKMGIGKEIRLYSKHAVEQRISTGRLMKWFLDGYIIKTSSINYNEIKPRFMYESYSEIIAYALTVDMGIRNTVEYKPLKLVIDDQMQTVGCICKTFLGTGERYRSIADLVESMVIESPTKFRDYYGYLKNIGINNNGFSETLDNSLLLDYVILNQDRHYGNFGIIASDQGKIRSAPIFDNGDSLFGSKIIDGIDYNRQMERHVMSRPFEVNHNNQLKLVTKRINKCRLDNTQRALDNLVNNWGLESHRAQFILELIKDRLPDIIKT